MAVARRLQGYSGMRVDWPHLRSLESAASFDFDSLIRGMVTGLNRPYLIRGFDIQIPTASIQASSLQVVVADSAILHSSATESGTILTVPAGTANDQLTSSNTKVIGAFQSGVPNYVSLDYRRVTDTTTTDQTAGWSPSQKIEYQRTTPIGVTLQYRYIIGTNGFSTNLPLWIVYVDNNGAVTDIEKGVTGLFRLGTGGAAPNPLSSFGFRNLTNTQPGANPRREWINQDTTRVSNPMTVQPGNDPNAFFYGDWTIRNLKDWMDAMMTRIKELSGSDYWYFSSALPGGGGGGGTGGLTLDSVWWDSIGSVMTGAGSLNYNLVMEATQPVSGKWQSSQTDNTILPGDAYVQGATSGNMADVSTFNLNELLINSQTSSAFIFDEILRERRLWRPNLINYEIVDVGEAATNIRWAKVGKKPNGGGGYTNVASWTFTNQQGSALEFTVVDVVTSTPHGFVPGNLIQTNTFALTGTDTPPNGSVQVMEVISTTEFTFKWPIALHGTPTAGQVRADIAGNIPYMPIFPVSAWSYAGTVSTITIPAHTFVAPLTRSGTTNGTDNHITGLSQTSDLMLGKRVSGTNIPVGSVITNILSSSSVEISQVTSGPGTNPVTFKDVVDVSGLLSTTNPSNGRFTVDALGSGPNQIVINTTLTPTGPATVNGSSQVRPDIYVFLLTVTGAFPNQYNLTNVNATAVSDTQVAYIVGPDTLPSLGSASGLIQLDGVVAYSTVQNPVRVHSITNDGSGNLTVVTTVPHGLTTNAGPLVFTIYGNPQNSAYITTYQGVSILFVNTTTFIIQNSGLIGPPTYTNPSDLDSTFIRFSDNPYPGPLQWTSDINIKGIIGDKDFTIPVTATCALTTQDPDVSPLANKFNTNGQTGTAYLQDGEVAFIKLQRNLQVSNGAVYSTPGGGTITGSTPPVDILGNPLVSGDFVKFVGEGEQYWIRIAGTPGTPIVANSFNVIDDQGQTPAIRHRPANVGQLVYCKGSYNLVYVKKHWLVDPSADSYWIAVRRDNGSAPSKMYVRALELSAGESRPVNDSLSNNLLIYTGAKTEAATNPNYRFVDQTGSWQATQSLTITTADVGTRMVTVDAGPDLGFQKGDQFTKTVGLVTTTYTVQQLLSSRTVIVAEDVSNLSNSDLVIFQRLDYSVQDSDNLTLGIRKEDRELAKVNTALTKPVYDESAYPQQISLSGSGTVRSGSYIYTGPQSTPTALAWVLHGNASVVETIESAPITMPGGHASIGPNAILVHMVSGTFNDGDGLYQNGSLTGRTVNNPSNPPFPSPTLVGGTGGSGLEIVLVPNRRTQVLGTGYVVFPTWPQYNASIDPVLAGEDLIVHVNDAKRRAVIDYAETFGGPKAKIQFIRDCPPNTRLEFRVQSAFGSALAAKAGGVSLQSAYNGGRQITETPGAPVELTASNVTSGETALLSHGSIEIDGGPSQLGGLFGTADQGFVIGDESNKPKEAWAGLDAVKTQASHPGSAWVRETAAQTVVGNSGTIITGSAIPIANATTYRIRISATARRSDGTHGAASFTLDGTFYEDGSGVVAAGFPVSTNNGADGDGINYALAFGISGSTVVAVAYGNGTTQWVLSIEYQAVSLAS